MHDYRIIVGLHLFVNGLPEPLPSDPANYWAIFDDFSRYYRDPTNTKVTVIKFRGVEDGARVWESPEQINAQVKKSYDDHVAKNSP